MAVLLEILIETVLLIGFLWIGKSIMKAEVSLGQLALSGLAGAFASQVPFVGMYLSFVVVLFFMWKMARIDMIPDGVLIVVIGKGLGLIMMIYVVGLLFQHVDPPELVSGVEQIPIYTDEEGKRYFTEGDKVYYLDENEEKVFVDANELFGISDVMTVADAESGAPGVVADEESDVSLEELEAPVIDVRSDQGFSEPLLSDSVVRGSPQPFEVYVPSGWMVSKSHGLLSVRFEDHTYLNYYSQASDTNNKTYLRGEVDRILSGDNGYKAAKQEIIKLDGKQWARIHFINSSGDQVLLMTHANGLNCYSIEVTGSFAQLSEKKTILHRMMYSFNFPPSTYYFAQLEAEE